MEVSQSNVVLIIEGRDSARAIAPFAANRWPGRQVLLVYTRSLALLEFRYPDGLTEADSLRWRASLEAQRLGMGYIRLRGRVAEW